MRKNSFKLFGLALILATLALAATREGQLSLSQQAAKIRWDIVSLKGGAPPIQAGGVAYALANDGSSIKLTGSGTFGPSVLDPITGGGAWTTYDPAGNTVGEGTYTVVGLVKSAEAPGTIPDSVPDEIGKPADARAGVVFLRITYSDGEEGVLVINCHLPVGSPSSIGEGVTASKGFVHFQSHVPPVPGVDANRTVFHKEG